MPERVNKVLLCLVIGWVVRGLYIFMFPGCYSFDLHSWNQVADILMAGGNPYHETAFLNWPPCWMQLLFLCKKISLAAHWPLNNVLRGFLILVESGLMVLLYAAIVRFAGGKNAAKHLILGVAVNPICIYQVCQHCNFDVLAGLWILLAVFMVLRFQEAGEARFWLAACFALGMGALTKTVPLSLAPLLLLSVRKLKLTEQLLGGVLLLGPVTLALSIVYVLAPADIDAKVLGYRSVPGGFGFTGLFRWLGADHLLAAWPHIFTVIYGCGWLAAGLWLWRGGTLDRRQVVAMAAVFLVAIPALGPGYGLQNIYWFLPLLAWLHALEKRPAKMFLLTMYAVAAAVYTVEYAFNYTTYGAFWLDIIQTQTQLQEGLKLSSQNSDTWVTLPLWIVYCLFVAGYGGSIAVGAFRSIRGRVSTP